MPLAVHRREDGGLVWSGSDVVIGDVTRGNPQFTLYDESLVTRVLVEDGRAAGVEVTDRRTRRELTRCARASSWWPRTPCARRSCCGPPASVPTPSGRYLNDQAQIVFAVRIRDSSRSTQAGAAAQRRG